MSSSSQGNKTPYCTDPGGMNPCRRRRNQYWPRAILVSSHLTYAILVVEHNSMLSSFCQPQKTSCFPDNLQLSYYSCRHLAPFSHTTFCSFSVHCNYNVPIFCILCISRVELVLQFAYMIYQEKMTKMVIGGSQSRENTVKLQYCRKKELQ